MAQAKLARELRQSRVGWMMCEFLGDSFAERLHAGAIDVPHPEKYFQEYLDTGIFKKEMTREEILDGWYAAGLLKDLEAKAKTEMQLFQKTESAFKAATHGFSRWCAKINLAFVAEPEHEYYFHQGEYARRFEWRWSVLPGEPIYFNFCVFLVKQDTEESRELHRIILHRYRNSVQWAERMEASYRETRINGNRMREIGERINDILLLPAARRTEALEELRGHLLNEGLLAIGLSWRRTWEWNSENIKLFMEFKGWTEAELAQVLRLELQTVQRILSGEISGIAGEAAQRLDIEARKSGWTPKD
jgi:hypothetical protein